LLWFTGGGGVTGGSITGAGVLLVGVVPLAQLVFEFLLLPVVSQVE
jgi:hypothetical protein